jgi:hypothetical protein
MYNGFKDWGCGLDIRLDYIFQITGLEINGRHAVAG